MSKKNNSNNLNQTIANISNKLKDKTLNIVETKATPKTNNKTKFKTHSKDTPSTKPFKLTYNSIDLTPSFRVVEFLTAYLLKYYEDLGSKRLGVEQVWQDIINLTRPERANNGLTTNNGFTTNHASSYIFDSTAMLASELLISSVWSLASSSANQWFHLQPQQQDLLNNQAIKSWFTEVNTIMKQNLQHTASGFYHKSYEFYADLIAFGTGVNTKQETVFSCKPLESCYIDSSCGGKVDIIFHKFYLTPAQAIKQFGANELDVKIIEAYNKGNTAKILFLHCVLPKDIIVTELNASFNDEAQNLYYRQDIEFLSYYLDVSNKKIVKKLIITSFHIL